MMPPISYVAPVTASGGAIHPEMHRWLQLIQRALHGPFIGQKATGSFTVKDGEYAIHADELILHGSETVTLEGNATLVVL